VAAGTSVEVTSTARRIWSPWALTNRAHSPVPLCTATVPALTMAPSASWSSQW
jgi:hypothetical protein